MTGSGKTQQEIMDQAVLQYPAFLMRALELSGFDYEQACNRLAARLAVQRAAWEKGMSPADFDELINELKVDDAMGSGGQS